jgi:hypothetical protein
MLALMYTCIMLKAGKNTTCLLNVKLAGLCHWLEKLDQYRSAVSQKEVTGLRHLGLTNDITVSVVGSARHWNSACYPINLVWSERFEIHVSGLILCSILCFIHLSFILYTSKI